MFNDNYYTLQVQNYLNSYKGLSNIYWRRVSISFISTITSGVIFFLTIYFINYLKFSVTISSLIISCYGIGTTLGGILGAKLANKTNPHIVSIVSLIFKAISFFLLAFIQTPQWLMIVIFIIGFTTSSFITTNNTLILLAAKDNELIRHKSLNILYASTNLALGLSAVIISNLTLFGFHLIFPLFGVLLITVVIYELLCAKIKLSYSTNLVKMNIMESNSNISSLKHDIKLYYLSLICLFLVGLVIAQINSTYPLYIQQKFPNWGMKGVGIFGALNTFLIVILQAPIGSYFSRNNSVGIMGIGAFLLCTGMIILNLTSKFLGIIVVCFIYTIGEMLFMSTAQLVCFKNSQANKKSTSLGIFQTVFAFSTVIGPILGGYILQNLGGNWLWYISGLIGAICLFGCLALISYSKINNLGINCLKNYN